MKYVKKTAIIFFFFFCLMLFGCRFIPRINMTRIIDHTCTDISIIPVQFFTDAKNSLHISYGHTSHGSQLTTGMSGLDAFMALQGYDAGTFTYNENGSGGALHLSESGLSGDAGYYPDWVNITRDFLGNPDTATGRGEAQPEYNVIMWAWCGQLSGYTNLNVNDRYLDPMEALENDYPGITFIYMTGHLDGSGLTGQLHQNNEAIREYCRVNRKWLYDFADIETYDPDGVYYGDRYATDGCNYDADGNGVTEQEGDPAVPIEGSGDRNWAIDWQELHVENVDWYDCAPSHTWPLNANRKAYASWWLWARLAGWGE
ncbi:MAG: hypothetical protein JW904_11880 [Spirochaetales bacterium]|nr:hypothetical protein [Spirochaetales bacterium]